MEYFLFKNDSIVGNGLSQGELIQWVLDLNKNTKNINDILNFVNYLTDIDYDDLIHKPKCYLLEEIENTLYDMNIDKFDKMILNYNIQIEDNLYTVSKE